MCRGVILIERYAARLSSMGFCVAFRIAFYFYVGNIYTGVDLWFFDRGSAWVGG